MLPLLGTTPATVGVGTQRATVTFLPRAPMRYRFRPSFTMVAGAVAGLLLMVPSHISAQVSQRDSSDLVKAARKRQRDFEGYRQSRIPVESERTGGGCDERIGNICIWFGGEGEEDFPSEPTQTGLARRSLIGTFLETMDQISDPWVMGQLVHYLVEQRDLRGAEQVARQCGISEAWWCAALLGYVMHVRGNFTESEAAFRTAIASMPEDELERWATLRYVIPRDDARDWERQDSEDRNSQWELYWRLSDPLFLLDGNDRMTDHFARWVEAKNHEDAEHPQMEWDEYVEETLVRYGRTIGWSRTNSPAPGMRGGGFQLQDNRRVVGHHHPNSRGYLFPEGFLQSPSDIPALSWITAPREARTWYAPPYAPDFTALETQVGRFRRGEQMLVVGAYRPTVAAVRNSERVPQAWAVDPDLGKEGPIQAGLFLIPEDGGEASEVRGSDTEGVLVLQSPPGRYVSSLEVLDGERKRAWRARQGVKQVPLVPGLVGVSDLMILTEGAPFPTTLDEAIPHVRPGVRVRSDERFAIIWEVYGLQVQDIAEVTIGFTEGRPEFLTEVGDFLGELEPDRPVEVTFEDAGPDGVQSAFRAIVLELPDVEPGDYTLHLRLKLPGREAVFTSRPIIVGN